MLENLAGITDPTTLAAFEFEATRQRLAELVNDRPIPPTFDTAHLKTIHRYVFQDIYLWAGEFRTVNITKCSSLFFGWDTLEERSRELFGLLADAGWYRGLDRDEFAGKATLLLTDLNLVHPFREGNGRTQRVFIGQVAEHAGWTIDWAALDKTALANCSERAHLTGDRTELAGLVRTVISPITTPPVPRSDTGRCPRRARLRTVGLLR